MVKLPKKIDKVPESDKMCGFDPVPVGKAQADSLQKRVDEKHRVQRKGRNRHKLM